MTIKQFLIVFAGGMLLGATVTITGVLQQRDDAIRELKYKYDKGEYELNKKTGQIEWRNKL